MEPRYDVDTIEPTAIHATSVPNTSSELPVTQAPALGDYIVNASNDSKEELEAARKRYKEAFDRYTNLTTGQGSGSIEEALKEYSQAYTEFKKLEAAAAIPYMDTDSSGTFDTSGIVGIVDISEEDAKDLLKEIDKRNPLKP